MDTVGWTLEMDTVKCKLGGHCEMDTVKRTLRIGYCEIGTVRWATELNIMKWIQYDGHSRWIMGYFECIDTEIDTVRRML